MIKKKPQTIYLEKETKDKLRYVSYKTDKSQSKVISEALTKHLEEEIKINPGYAG
jgi:predicted DNA-binding protein